MKFLVFSFLLLALVAFMQNAAADDSSPLSEPTAADLHVVTPDEMAALGFAEAARARICIVSQCDSICRRLGYKVGRCTTNAYCVCSL